MQRFMWIVNPTMSPRYVQDACYGVGEGFVVPRVFTTSKRSCWAMITSERAYDWACVQFMVDLNVGPWTITACNKQYVTDKKHAKYLGCLGEVEVGEAKSWISEHPDNFYLSHKGDTKIIWIPLMRNPNKMIPSGEPCRVCDGTGYIRPLYRPLQTPKPIQTRMHRPQYRPWPLEEDA